MRVYSFTAALLLTVILLFAQHAVAQEVPPVDLGAIDEIFEVFNGTFSPGCAVGVSSAGEIFLERAYGMADLEHDVTNRPETVFEPGSVSKQFTAAATILLALEGRLSLDDDIRTFLPELPEYQAPITIRHLIHHTSGLRDWGTVAAIEGWPRTTRVYTHAQMLDITSRQMALNYRPGEYYSYTNTGYNLQVVIIERVSGMSFAEFSKTRLFEPLGMTHTEWRDDFTRIVKDRAIAYVPGNVESWNMLMPFENVHGNGGLLTTVGDLLRWAHNLETGALGGDIFLEAMHHLGVLNSGETIPYASGLRIGEYRGVSEISHTGSTAGYRGFLTRFPEQEISIALMCNVSSADTLQLGHRVADLFLDEVVSSDLVSVALPREQLDIFAGGYRDTRSGAFMPVESINSGLRVQGTLLLPVSEDRFEAPGLVLEFVAMSPGDGRQLGVFNTPTGRVLLEPVGEFVPTAADLLEYAGTYWSEEAEATYVVEVEGEQLVIKSRYSSRVELTPAYLDAFASQGRTAIFRRNGSNQVNGMSLSLGRVWDLRFQKLPKDVE